MNTDTTQAAIALALEWSQMHERLAAESPRGSDEQRAHLSTMTALDKAITEMTRGNVPLKVADDTYMIESRKTSGKVYRVNVSTNQCNGADCRGRCWHLASAQVMQAAEESAGVKAQEAERLARFVAEHGDMQIVEDAFRLEKDIVDLDDINPDAWDDEEDDAYIYEGGEYLPTDDDAQLDSTPF